MSTLEVSNLNDGTTTVATTYITNGSAKAWVNFNGDGTVAIRDSQNVSSITDNGTGAYTINFSNAFGAADFACTSACGESLQGSTNFFCNPYNVLVGEVSLAIYSAAASSFDRDTVHGIVMGDLA